jgi:septal ring factor EnvC (AmiA/AmiB activator)
MTNSNNDNLEIRALLAELTRCQIQTQEQIQATQEQIETTQEQLRELTSDTNRVLARSAILDDVVLELRENQETMQQNFEQHQRNERTTPSNY